ncbi:MAG TPA: hypothetical protein VN048_15220, partial [Verrucomicrobiae bacterium]|nr:hypothetical protein [Verrucomicrobiae bacterium]
EDAKDNVERWRIQLEDEQKQFQDLTRDEQEKLSLLVLKSHYTQNHIPIFICSQQQSQQSAKIQSNR